MQPSEIDIKWIEQAIQSASSTYSFEWCEEIIHHINDDNLRKKLFKLIDTTAKKIKND